MFLSGGDRRAYNHTHPHRAVTGGRAGTAQTDSQRTREANDMAWHTRN